MRSIVELRATAQALNIPFTFADDSRALEQKINLHMNAKYVPPHPQVIAPITHALRSKPAPRMTRRDELEEALKPLINRGLRLSFPQEETWQFEFSKKKDTGTMRQPLRTILQCAEDILR